MAKQFVNGEFKGEVAQNAVVSGEPGRQRVAVLFKLLAGPQEGEFITWSGGLEDGGAEITSKGLQTLGWDPDTQDDFTVVNFTGKQFNLVIADRKYTNNSGAEVTVSEVKFINELGRRPDIAKKALPAAEATAAAKSFAATARANKKAQGGGARASHGSEYQTAPAPAVARGNRRPAAPPANSPDSDDDVPF